jgi:hypothetical protein
MIPQMSDIGPPRSSSAQEVVSANRSPKNLIENHEEHFSVKKRKFFPVVLSDSSDSSDSPSESTIKGEIALLKRNFATGNAYQDWKLSEALKRSSSVGEMVKKSISVDTNCSHPIDREIAVLDYLHANACPAPLPSELIKVPSFHSQELVLDEEDDVEAILQEFL